MSLLGFIDKIDDIIYEPIKVICDYARQPAKAIEAKIELENEKKKIQLQYDIEKQRAEDEVELRAKERKMNEEINKMIADNELKRRTDLLDAVKKYQIDLSHAVNECVNEIGLMSLELREKANNMMVEKTKMYKALQDDSKNEAKKELVEIAEMFADNERVRIRMEDAVMDQMTDMIKTASIFINELSQDMKRLNENIDRLAKQGQDMINTYLSPMTAKLTNDSLDKAINKL